jgi:uncharacterized protein (DUF924 family)
MTATAGPGTQPRRQLAHELLEYWFGPRPYQPEAIAARMPLWFGGAGDPARQAATDAELATRFGAAAQAAAAGEYASWASSPRRSLALVLLLDQLPRNLHRGTATAFAQDRAALELVVAGMHSGADAALEPIERMFYYLPLQHAESLAVQEESLAACRRLPAEATPGWGELFAGVLEFARQHHAIIARFGRFPHRNVALARESTPEELAWLAESGERFGQ